MGEKKYPSTLLAGTPYSGEESITYVLKAKYKNTEHNKKVYGRFTSFAKEFTDNNYFLAIEKLLDNYEEDWKYNFFEKEISDIRARIEEVSLSLEQKTGDEEESVKTFG